MKKPKYSFLEPEKKSRFSKGRPSEYDPDYCDQMFEFFDIPPFVMKETISFNKFGNKCVTYVETPNPIPFFINFAKKIGVHRDTIQEWTHVHPEFAEAHKECKELQQNFLTENAMRGNHNATAYRFAAINYTAMRDKVEIESKNTNNNITISQADARKIADKMAKDLKL
jgi:hypothetical protein